MKTLTLAFLLIACSARAQYATNFYAIPDKTPGLTNSVVEWGYPEPPGAYFWNGFRTACVMGLLCLAVGAGVRYWARD